MVVSIAHLKRAFFLTNTLKCILASSEAIGVKRADKDNVRLRQVSIASAPLQRIHIKLRPIVARAFRKTSELRRIGGLHFDVIDRPRLVFDIDVEADALAPVVDLDLLFGLGEREPTNVNAENPFKEFFTERGIAHHLLKDKVVTEIEL